MVQRCFLSHTPRQRLALIDSWAEATERGSEDEIEQTSLALQGASEVVPSEQVKGAWELIEKRLKPEVGNERNTSIGWGLFYLASNAPPELRLECLKKTVGLLRPGVGPQMLGGSLSSILCQTIEYRILDRFPEGDLAEAFEAVRQKMLPEYHYDAQTGLASAASKIAVKMGAADPVAAIESLVSLTDPQLKRHANEEIIIRGIMPIVQEVSPVKSLEVLELLTDYLDPAKTGRSFDIHVEAHHLLPDTPPQILKAWLLVHNSMTSPNSEPTQATI
jgi:hypothetical protein